MSLSFAKITKDNVDDLMSLCGNMPGMGKHPAFVEGRKARRQWLLDMAEKFGTVGMLAMAGMARRGALSSACRRRRIRWAYFRPTSRGRRSSTAPGTGWTRMATSPAGLAIRKAILDEMFAGKFFDKLLGKKCRYVDVLTLKNAPIMQYDFYRDYGFKDAVEFTGHATARYLLRYPALGDAVEGKAEQLSFDSDAGKNVLVIGTYSQCHLPSMVAGEKVTKAVEGIEGLKIKVVDYWETGVPALCEPTINGRPAFDGPVYFMDDEGIKEAVSAKMIR